MKTPRVKQEDDLDTRTIRKLGDKRRYEEQSSKQGLTNANYNILRTAPESKTVEVSLDKSK